jgi:hypothetical protein
MRYVQAVVSCWGGVVAGTQGLRAQHARIDAIWLHPNVPTWARQRVAARYPSARVYADRRAMLAEHPLSQLDCYEDSPSRRSLPRAAAALSTGALLALGCLPTAALHQSHALWSAWLVATGAVAAIALWLLVGTHSIGHRAAAFVLAGLLAWLLAPMFGLAGWLLRAPLLRAAAVVAGGYLLSLRPGFFPIEHTPRERAFCGVRV